MEAYNNRSGTSMSLYSFAHRVFKFIPEAFQSPSHWTLD